MNISSVLVSPPDRSVKRQFFFWSILLGAICFAVLYGFNALDVTNDIWLLNAEDLNQHYIGWKFFRRSNWHFPIGLIDGITAKPISIIYTDSIPVFAILFKLLSPILPSTFQYFGLWALTCFVLQAYFAMILLHAFIKDNVSVVLGSVFFVLSPIVLMRMFTHSALGGNWIILAALSAWAHGKSIKGYRHNITVWGTLMALAVSIHIYFVPMIFAIMCANGLNQFLDNKNKVIAKLLVTTIGASVMIALFTMFVLGAFYGESNVLQGGVREFSTNLNSFYNSRGLSLFMRGYPLISHSQGEGYAYLGVGIMAIMLLGAMGEFISKGKVNAEGKNALFSVGVLTFVCGGYALSPRVTWNDKILFDIPWPNVVIKIFSIFRATGRFIWPVYYIIFVIAIVLLTKVFAKKNRLAHLFIVLGLFLQIADNFPLINSVYNRTKSNVFPSIIQNNSWEELNGSFDNIEFITSFSNIGDPNSIISNFFPVKKVFDIANYACDNNMNINDFYIGRRNGKYIEELKYSYWQDLLAGKANERTIYIFSKMPYNLASSTAINLYKCDGLFLGVSKNYKWKNEPQDKIISTKIIDLLPESSIINGEIVEGNHIIHPNGISYGPYIPVGEGTYKIIIEGLNLVESKIDVFDNQQNKFYPMLNFNITSEKASFDLVLDEMIYNMEIRLADVGNNNIEIKKVYIQKIGDGEW